MLEAVQGNNATTSGPNVQDPAYLGTGLGEPGQGQRFAPQFPLPAPSWAPLPQTCYFYPHTCFSWPSSVVKGLPEMQNACRPCSLAHVEDGLDKTEGIQASVSEKVGLAGSESS